MYVCPHSRRCRRDPEHSKDVMVSYGDGGSTAVMGVSGGGAGHLSVMEWGQCFLWCIWINNTARSSRKSRCTRVTDKINTIPVRNVKESCTVERCVSTCLFCFVQSVCHSSSSCLLRQLDWSRWEHKQTHTYDTFLKDGLRLSNQRVPAHREIWGIEE